MLLLSAAQIAYQKEPSKKDKIFQEDQIQT